MPRRKLEDLFWQVSGDVVVVSAGQGLKSAMTRRFWEPHVDLFEDERHFLIRAELAGIHPQQMQVVYLPDRHSVLVRGVRSDEDVPGFEKKACHQLEIFYGEFEREITLPADPVEPDHIKAQYRSGLLYLLIPKSKARVRHITMTIRKV
jgi:HSP20 family protein